MFSVLLMNALLDSNEGSPDLYLVQPALLGPVEEGLLVVAHHLLLHVLRTAHAHPSCHQATVDQGWKKPGFKKKKPAQWVFLVFCFFFGFF